MRTGERRREAFVFVASVGRPDALPPCSMERETPQPYVRRSDAESGVGDDTCARTRVQRRISRLQCLISRGSFCIQL